MEKLKFRVTATVTKIIEVEVDLDGKTYDEVIEAGQEMAREQFSVLVDGNEEKYEEDYYLFPPEPKSRK